MRAVQNAAAPAPAEPTLAYAIIKQKKEPLVGGAGSGGRAGVPDGVQAWCDRSGSPARGLTRTSISTRQS
jgi:hypothetical protein